MNKYLIVCMVAVLLAGKGAAQVILPSLNKGESYNSQQDILVSNPLVTLQDGEIKTSKTLTLSGAALRLGNVTLSAKKIVIATALANLRIIGTVVLEADEIEIASLPAGGSNVPLTCTGSGSMIFLYKSLDMGVAASRYINYTPVEGQNLSIEFRKK